MNFSRWMAVSACTLLAAEALFCQQAVTTATLSGRVEDLTGAAVPGAAITLRYETRGQELQAASDPQGRYLFIGLLPGDYVLSVREPRFALFEARLSLSAGQAVDLPAPLAIAGLQQTMVVTAETTPLEAARTQLSHAISSRAVDSLPLNGRNYLDLALLAPGVSRTNTGAPQQFAETSAVPGTGISVSGQRNLSNSFIVDGLSGNDDAAGLAGAYFSQEVIREFQVVTSGANAEFGRASSAVVNVTTRSGGDAWHGRAYAFLRNQRLDARNPLAVRKDPLTQTQYGASAGGPIARDRTFLFSNFEQTHRHAAGLVTIAPQNAEALNAVLDSTGYRGPRLATGEYPTGWDMTSYFAKVEHQFTPRSRASARYSLYDVASPNARSAGGLNDVSRGTRLDNRDQTLALSVSTAPSGASFNEARLQVTRNRLAAPANDRTGPAVTIPGVASFGASTSSPEARDNNLYELADTATFQRGSHVLKAGADFLWNRLDIVFPGALLAPVYSFPSLAAFRAGSYSTFQQAFGEPGQFQSSPNAGLFAQDTWRLRSGLLVEAGLRYDVQWLPAPMRTNPGGVSPRMGIAFSPGNRKTVVRANYGLYYDRIPLRAISNALQRDGSKYRTAILAFGQAGAPTFPTRLPAFPAGQFINITTIDANIRPAYSHQAGFQIDRELASRITVSAGYQWVRALHLILSRNLNVPTLAASDAALLGIANLGRPDSRYGNVSHYESGGDSYYNGFTASLNSRLWSGGNLRLAYNLSKTIDDVGNFFFSSPQDNSRLRDDRGLSDNDQRRRLSLAAFVLCKGWTLSPMLVYTSTLPFNVQVNYDRNRDTNLNDRPYGVGRNTGRGFDFLSADLRLSRAFHLAERWKIEAMLESFNTLNRVNRALPNNIVSLPTFGQATAVYDPRQLQVALRTSW